MIKSGYREGIFYREDFHLLSEEIEKDIRILLRDNHGVGILGGTFGDGYPLCLISDLTMQMLGYDSAEEFERATDNLLANLLVGQSAKNEFTVPSVIEVYMKGKSGDRRVRIVSRRETSEDGSEFWLASVCDMDALYRKVLQVDRITSEKQQRETEHQAELERANAELSKQKKTLEAALADAETSNEIISAIGDIYWLIYRLDLTKDTFEEISVRNGRHVATGKKGCTSEVFTEACKETISPEYRKIMLEFLDTRTLADRLADRDQIPQEFRTIKGNWHRGRFIVQKRDENGRAVKVLYTLQPISEQKQRELEYEKRLADIAEEAQRASLSKTDFLRRMSHDIRTPINGIRGMIEIANHFDGDLKKQRECREKIWEASGYLLSLVNNVLDMNKLESGAVIFAHNQFDLPTLLEEINTVAEMQATEHGLNFQVDHKKRHIEHRFLIGSPSHIKQILMNIAGNAVKYNKENGSVTVWCEELLCDGTAATFRFNCADTGIGMSEDFQKHAFEPFTQEGKNNARTRYDGSGLGLSITKALTEQMGGHIEFTTKEGVGTTFSVILPIAVDHDPPEESQTEEHEPIDLTGYTILLAEDNELNMEIAKFFLEQHGATVISAKNGSEAVNLFTASAPGDIDLILMDIIMPIMNGHEATLKIRSADRPDAKTIPIVAMTTNAFQDDVDKSLSVGMNDHLPKPLGTEKMLSTVFRYIRSHPRRSKK